MTSYDRRDGVGPGKTLIDHDAHHGRARPQAYAQPPPQAYAYPPPPAQAYAYPPPPPAQAYAYPPPPPAQPRPHVQIGYRPPEHYRHYAPAPQGRLGVRSFQRAVLAAPVPSEERWRQRHELSLLLGGRCGACAEELPRGDFLRGTTCPSCGEAAFLEPEARRLVVDHLRRKSRARVKWIAIAVAVAQLFVGWIPIVSSIVLALAAASIRFHIVQPASRLLAPGRRRVATWSARLATAALVAVAVILHELLTLLPIAGPLGKSLLSAAEIVFIAWASARYMAWQVNRENREIPVSAEEYALLGGAAFTLVFSAAAVIAAIAFVVVAIGKLTEYLDFIPL